MPDPPHVKALRKKLRSAQSKIDKLLPLKDQLKEQAKIIKGMEKKVAAYDALVIEKMRLKETIGRLEKQLDETKTTKFLTTTFETVFLLKITKNQRFLLKINKIQRNLQKNDSIDS